MSVTFTICTQCLRLNRIHISEAQAKDPTCGACHSLLPFHGGLSNLNTQQLQKLIQKSPLPVVVDFWAPWCGPCRIFSPRFEQVAGEMSSQFVFVKLNTETDPSAGSVFGIQGIPTVALFKNGQEVARQSGALPIEYFKSWLIQS